MVPEFRRESSELVDILNRRGVFGRNAALSSRASFLGMKEDTSIVFCMVKSRRTKIYQHNTLKVLLRSLMKLDHLGGETCHLLSEFE